MPIKHVFIAICLIHFFSQIAHPQNRQDSLNYKTLEDLNPDTKTDNTIFQPIYEVPGDRAVWDYKGYTKFSKVFFKVDFNKDSRFEGYDAGFLVEGLTLGSNKLDFVISLHPEKDSIIFYQIVHYKSFDGAISRNNGFRFEVISAKTAGISIHPNDQNYSKEELSKLELKLNQWVKERNDYFLLVQNKLDENKKYINDIKSAQPGTALKFMQVPTAWPGTKKSKEYKPEVINVYKLNMNAKDSFFVAQDLRGKNFYYAWIVYLFDVTNTFTSASAGIGGQSLYTIREDELPTNNSSVAESLEKINSKLLDILNGRLTNFTGFFYTGYNPVFGNTGLKYWGIKKDKNGVRRYGKIEFSTIGTPGIDDSKPDNQVIFYPDGRKKIIAERLSLGELVIESNRDTVFHDVRLTSNGKILLNGIDLIDKSVSDPYNIKKENQRGSDCISNQLDGNVIMRQQDGTLIAGNFGYLSASNTWGTQFGFMRKSNGDIYFGKFNLYYGTNLYSGEFSSTTDPLKGDLILLKNSGDILIGNFNSEQYLTENGTILFSNGDLANFISAEIDFSGISPASKSEINKTTIKISGISDAVYIDAAKKETYKGFYYYNGLRSGEGIIYSADGTSKKVVYKDGVLQQ